MRFKKKEKIRTDKGIVRDFGMDRYTLVYLK